MTRYHTLSQSYPQIEHFHGGGGGYGWGRGSSRGWSYGNGRGWGGGGGYYHPSYPGIAGDYYYDPYTNYPRLPPTTCFCQDAQLLTNPNFRAVCPAPYQCGVCLPIDLCQQCNPNFLCDG